MIKKRIAVILLSICFLVAGCSDLESYESVSEVIDGSIASEIQNSSSQETSAREQEQPPAINPIASAFFEDILEDIYSSLSVVRPPHGGFYLSYERAEEFLSGIDFSQLKPIDDTSEKYNTDFLDSLVLELEMGASGIEIIRNYMQGKLWLHLLIRGYEIDGVAVYTVYETYRDDPDAPLEINKFYYFYSINEEFYNAVLDRIEEYSQYGHPLGGLEG